MFYMVKYVTLTILTDHGILFLLGAKLSMLIRFNTYNIGHINIFLVLKKGPIINHFTKVNTMLHSLIIRNEEFFCGQNSIFMCI